MEREWDYDIDAGNACGSVIGWHPFDETQFRILAEDLTDCRTHERVMTAAMWLVDEEGG